MKLKCRAEPVAYSSRAERFAPGRMEASDRVREGMRESAEDGGVLGFDE